MMRTVGRPCDFESRSESITLLVVANIDLPTFPSFVRPFFCSLPLSACAESLAAAYRFSAEHQEPTVLAAIVLAALAQA